MLHIVGYTRAVCCVHTLTKAACAAGDGTLTHLSNKLILMQSIDVWN